MPTYYISQRLGHPPISVDLDAPPPCLFCGDPVVRPSTDGPLVCGLCDCGSNPDGSKWTREQATDRWRHRADQVAKYREAAGARCAHDYVRYALDASAASLAQKDGVDAAGRPYRDLPVAHAATIESDFAARVLEKTCVACGTAIASDKGRAIDSLPRKA